MLREHKIRKTYAAIVKGQVSLDKQLIDAPLFRYELANGERRVRVSKEGKPSKTEWVVAERFKMPHWFMLRLYQVVPIKFVYMV